MRLKEISISGLKNLDKKDWTRAVDCLTGAFSEDLCFRYMLESEVYDPKKARYIHEYTMKYGSLFGKVFTTENVEGVGIWLPLKNGDSSSFTTAVRFIRSGGLKLDKHVNKGTIAVIKKYGDYSGEMHHRIAHGQHWYLMSIGVGKEFQGQGFSKKLILPMLEYFDKNGHSCYLETHNPRNVSIYEKFGFKVMETGKLPGSDITHWAMMRIPQMKN
jgi:predicted GNAT family acetyltransferase